VGGWVSSSGRGLPKATSPVGGGILSREVSGRATREGIPADGIANSSMRVGQEGSDATEMRVGQLGGSVRGPESGIWGGRQ